MWYDVCICMLTNRSSVLWNQNWSMQNKNINFYANYARWWFELSKGIQLSWWWSIVNVLDASQASYNFTVLSWFAYKMFNSSLWNSTHQHVSIILSAPYIKSWFCSPSSFSTLIFWIEHNLCIYPNEIFHRLCFSFLLIFLSKMALRTPSVFKDQDWQKGDWKVNLYKQFHGSVSFQFLWYRAQLQG